MTKSETIQLLKNLAAIEGYLWGVRCENVSLIFESYIDPMVELLIKELETEYD